MASRTLRVMKDEWTFFGTLLPYVAMMMGAFLTFCLGAITRVGIMLQHNISATDIAAASRTVTWIILISCILLSVICWYLFSQKHNKEHSLLREHATVTVILIHLWLVLAVWHNIGDWFFGSLAAYTFFYGGLVVALSWCIRRWVDESHKESDGESNPFKEIGLGDAFLQKKNTRRFSTSTVFRMILPKGKTIEDAQKERISLAQIAGKPRNLVHVTPTESGIEGQVDIQIMDDDPFEKDCYWDGPDYPGESITYPVTYGTYDTGERPELYLSGKDGSSSEHFLTIGMPGSGKSKAWQAIYGSVLSRNDVSVVFGDPAKGMQTGGPLAAGLEWFAATEEECKQQISAIIEAIPARTNYLTSKGLDHWVPDCGLNFVIFHLEEAARFADVDDLVELVEAARSAGVCIVLSLQKATHDRIKTSTRYNLGGNMCFGVKMKSDAKFGLSEFALDAGATPHRWQNKKPGLHYLEASGIDPLMVGHPVKTDWLKISDLEAFVDAHQSGRKVLDDITASAFGIHYVQYREKVSQGTTSWQILRKNRGHHDDTRSDTPVITPELISSDNTSVQAVARLGFHTPVEETQAAKQHLNDILETFRGKSFTMAEIQEAGFTERSKSTLHSWLRNKVKDGTLVYEKKTGQYMFNPMEDPMEKLW